jgi:translation initiation factor 1
LEAECDCLPPPPIRTPPGEQTARLAVEKRKKGKIVTIVRGLSAEENDLPALCTQLKTACGAGGSVQEDVIEIQGNHWETIRATLGQIGYRVKG